MEHWSKMGKNLTRHNNKDVRMLAEYNQNKTNWKKKKIKCIAKVAKLVPKITYILVFEKITLFYYTVLRKRSLDQHHCQINLKNIQGCQWDSSSFATHLKQTYFFWGLTLFYVLNTPLTYFKFSFEEKRCWSASYLNLSVIMAQGRLCGT